MEMGPHLYGSSHVFQKLNLAVVVLFALLFLSFYFFFGGGENYFKLRTSSFLSTSLQP